MIIRRNRTLDFGLEFVLCSSGEVFACVNGDDDDEWHLDVAAGVDVAFVVTLWLAMDKIAPEGGMDAWREKVDTTTQQWVSSAHNPMDLLHEIENNSDN